jgi:phosphate:Na+ symporter
MDFMLTLIDLAGSVALLLWGVHMVQSGVQRTFGARLRAEAVTVRGIAPSRGGGIALVIEAITIVLSAPARRGAIALVIIAVTVVLSAPAISRERCGTERHAKRQGGCSNRVTHDRPPVRVC